MLSALSKIHSKRPLSLYRSVTSGLHYLSAFWQRDISPIAKGFWQSWICCLSPAVGWSLADLIFHYCYLLGCHFVCQHHMMMADAACQHKLSVCFLSERFYAYLWKTQSFNSVWRSSVVSQTTIPLPMEQFCVFKCCVLL